MAKLNRFLLLKIRYVDANGMTNQKWWGVSIHDEETWYIYCTSERTYTSLERVSKVK